MQDLADAIARALAPVAMRGPLTIAASGGADSTALAVAAATLRDAGRLPDGIVLAHCDHRQHQLHRVAADAVRALARRLGCRSAIVDLDLPPGASEARMREARYAALATIAREHHGTVLATAHHGDDQIETIVMRALRGTGRRGLAGIPLLREIDADLVVVRPLLGIRRARLREALDDLGVTFVEDPTNKDRRRTRARVRHEWLPERADRARFEARVLALAERAGRRAAATARSADRWMAAHARRTDRARIELDTLDSLAPQVAREVLRSGFIAILGTAPLGTWLDRALDCASRSTGARLHAQLGVERTRHGLLLLDLDGLADPPAEPVALQADGRVVCFGGTEWSLTAQLVTARAPPVCARREAAGFDADAAPGPWRLRAPRAADRYEAPGRTGSRALRAAMQTRGVPAFDRDRLPLLVDADDRIIWAPGLDVARFARVDTTTRNNVEIRRAILPGGIAPGRSSY